ncbi:LysR family transcriptional regulator [Amycolatopsis sp. WAC 01376]|uniref:LysR family transcriptional regulator n=1 Tax=Amycolatopsis sp. WAC 01376 TaxID=2203195 RepID=UPI000F79E804|nr:LysR family transcriptional regulator [Amycolatopsis sp. WAC 01376]RSM57434.1 LysR family transcriptional regulator [Amycolatopsis sp. WAC 01376]
MELRRLRYLCAVAEEGHLTRAAERLGIRASSLSQQIIALERELDATLFVRTQAGMTPTAAALALLPHAHRMLEEADLGARAVRDTVDRPLRIGVTPGAPPSVLPALYSKGAEIDDVSATRQLELLRRGALDAGLLALPEDVDGLRVVVVSERPLGVLVSDAHPLARSEDVGWEDLTGLDLLLYERKLAPGYHDALLADCAAAGWRPAQVRAGPPRRSLFVAELRHGGDVVALRPREEPAEGLRWLALREAPVVQHALVWDPAHESSDRIAALV